jgi:hypothetical protein
MAQEHIQYLLVGRHARGGRHDLYCPVGHGYGERHDFHARQSATTVETDLARGGR